MSRWRHDGGRPEASRTDLGLRVREVAALLQAGLTPERAWGPLLGSGPGSLEERISAFEGRISPGSDRLAAVYRLSNALGVPAAGLLEGCARAIDADQAAADARAAALAGPRATARVVTALPIFGLLLGVVMGADPLSVLLSGGIGTMILGLGLAALALGTIWTRSLLRAAARVPLDPEPFVLELVAAAIGSGAAIPAALAGTGGAMGGDVGADLNTVARRLRAGSRWSLAWRNSRFSALATCLAPAWEFGVAPVPLLRAHADAAHRSAANRAAIAAGRLGVRLLLPLGTCYLPAFALIGLAPVVLSLAGSVLGQA